MTKINLDKNGLANEAGMITVYNYHPQSGEYLGTTEEYLQQGVGVPANTTIVAPPTAKAGSATVFRGDHWQVIADHRGEMVYAVANGEATEITEPGDYPAGITTLKPSTIFDEWNGKEWVTNIEALHAAQVESAELKRSSLLAEAQARISLWQTELQLDVIENEDKTRLISWLSYIKALQKTDISAAPVVEWPVLPA
ncbi:tail fiber assembly protein [Pantoea sp. ACRSB]|uniref:tail fiber assembly protein n=1 Tax=Pantoea sp. ACRSB TaxID=2918207 RepID=UPI0028935890|nr:tail fiber assembly protein [Pantoea sp. ACRSB]MCG7389930.1 tail fiber assembly protein [Pantoea sp. ACRSB]